MFKQSTRTLINIILIIQGSFAYLTAMEQPTRSEKFYEIIKKLKDHGIITRFNKKKDLLELRYDHSSENECRYPAKRYDSSALIPKLTCTFKIITDQEECIHNPLFLNLLQEIITNNGTPSIFTQQNIQAIAATLNDDGEDHCERDVHLDNLFNEKILKLSCIVLIKKRSVPDGVIDTIINYWRPNHPWKTDDELRNTNMLWKLATPDQVNSYKREAFEIFKFIKSHMRHCGYPKQEAINLISVRYNLTPEQLELYHRYAALKRQQTARVQ